MNPLPTGRLLVPLANEDDARVTASAVEQAYGDVADDAVLVAVHVIEKASGTLDKAPLEARQEQAEAVFSTFRARLDSAGFDVDTELRYDTDVVEAIVETAATRDAAAIVFVPQPGSRLTELLSGSPSYRLLTESQIPVVALPVPNGE